MAGRALCFQLGRVASFAAGCGLAMKSSGKAGAAGAAAPPAQPKAAPSPPKTPLPPLNIGGKSAAPKALSQAAKKSLQRRVRITIGLAHRKMTASAVQEAVDLLEQAEKACTELGRDGEELLGEVHHALAYCHETLGDRTLCKVRAPSVQ